MTIIIIKCSSNVRSNEYVYSIFFLLLEQNHLDFSISNLVVSRLINCRDSRKPNFPDEIPVVILKKPSPEFSPIFANLLAAVWRRNSQFYGICQQYALFLRMRVSTLPRRNVALFNLISVSRNSLCMLSTRKLWNASTETTSSATNNRLRLNRCTDEALSLHRKSLKHSANGIRQNTFCYLKGILHVVICSTNSLAVGILGDSWQLSCDSVR